MCHSLMKNRSQYLGHVKHNENPTIWTANTMEIHGRKYKGGPGKTGGRGTHAEDTMHMDYVKMMPLINVNEVMTVNG